MNEKVNTFIELIDLRKDRQSGVTVIEDIRQMVTNCAIDVICETAMGVKIDAQRARPGQATMEQKYLYSLRELFDLIVKRIMTPWYEPEFLFRLFDDGKKHNEHVEILQKFTRNVIDQRMKEFDNSQTVDEKIGQIRASKKRVALLDLLLMYHLQDPVNFNLASLREEVDTFMFGGHDTTSAALHFAYVLIGLNPDKQVSIFVSKLI